MTKIKTHVLCCGGTGCKASASDEQPLKDY